MEATFWALVPAIFAIVVSLITKEVNLSLLMGIVIGAAIITGGNPMTTVTTVVDVMSEKVYSNMGVIIFLILLGMVVYLMNLSGATKKYALWASRKLTTKRQTLLATMALGVIIFVDDYFNCLTVGTVMRPITDRNKISREKLAYIIDSTAAPVCIIAPISSWAAAVSSSLPDGSAIDGFKLFMMTIPYNFYSWLCLGMVLLTVMLDVDFGKMRRCEIEARAKEYIAENEEDISKFKDANGSVMDLLLPVLVLIAFSILGMLYTGGILDGVGITEAFANCDAITGLVLGAVYTMIFLAIFYIPRKVVTGKQFMEGLSEGFKNMVPTILILTFAWSLSGICGEDYLNAGGFVTEMVTKYNISLNIMPMIFFVVAMLLSFATGTSWGTFAILLPITISICGDTLNVMTAMTTAAVLGGSVCGDHVSPISDTTILSSTGAGCDHISHVSTQMQYGIVVAAISIMGYVISGITENLFTGLLAGVIMLCAFIFAIKVYTERKKAPEAK